MHNLQARLIMNVPNPTLMNEAGNLQVYCNIMIMTLGSDLLVVLSP